MLNEWELLGLFWLGACGSSIGRLWPQSPGVLEVSLGVFAELWVSILLPQLSSHSALILRFVYE